jgi:hypothetical protein
MMSIDDTKVRLQSKSDLDWFDEMCYLLKRENVVTVALLTDIIGKEDTKYSKENRGSKFLIPFDKRFNIACINPDIDSDKDVDIEYLSVGGKDFNLKIKEVKERFGEPHVLSNVYDGGTQLFFHPISESYKFTALSCDIIEEKENIINVDDIVVNSISFHFRQNLIKHRAGYSMI